MELHKQNQKSLPRKQFTLEIPNTHHVYFSTRSFNKCITLNTLLRKERKMYLYSNQPYVPVCPRTSSFCPGKTKIKHSLAIVNVKKRQNCQKLTSSDLMGWSSGWTPLHLKFTGENENRRKIESRWNQT